MVVRTMTDGQSTSRKSMQNCHEVAASFGSVVQAARCALIRAKALGVRFLRAILRS